MGPSSCAIASSSVNLQPAPTAARGQHGQLPASPRALRSSRGRRHWCGGGSVCVGLPLPASRTGDPPDRGQRRLAEHGAGDELVVGRRGLVGEDGAHQGHGLHEGDGRCRAPPPHTPHGLRGQARRRRAAGAQGAGRGLLQGRVLAQCKRVRTACVSMPLGCRRLLAPLHGGAAPTAGGLGGVRRSLPARQAVRRQVCSIASRRSMRSCRPGSLTECHPVRDVADRPDIGHAGLTDLADLDGALVAQLHASFLRQASAPNVGLLLAPTRCGHPQAGGWQAT